MRVPVADETVAGRQDVLGGDQGPATEVPLVVEDGDDPGVLVLLQSQSNTLITSLSLLTLAVRPPRILIRLRVLTPHLQSTELASWYEE